jgi:hypothetical protein
MPRSKTYWLMKVPQAIATFLKIKKSIQSPKHIKYSDMSVCILPLGFKCFAYYVGRVCKWIFCLWPNKSPLPFNCQISFSTGGENISVGSGYLPCGLYTTLHLPPAPTSSNIASKTDVPPTEMFDYWSKNWACQSIYGRMLTQGNGE